MSTSAGAQQDGQDRLAVIGAGPLNPASRATIASSLAWSAGSISEVPVAMNLMRP
jgi:hypothetical protein